MHTAPQVVAETDLTYRQLDYWIRRGVIREEPSVNGRVGSGHPRSFTDDELRVVKVLAALRALGCSLDTLTEVAEQLRSWPEPEWHGFVFVDSLAGLQRRPCNRCVVIDLDEVLA
jgi:DNA-binding transcriptional MerR regulator